MLKAACRSIVLVVGVVLMTAARAGGDPTVILELKENVVVAGHDVRLDQMAGIQAKDHLSGERLAALQLHIDSLPGQVERITRDDIQALVALQLPDLSGHIVWTGKGVSSRVHLQGRPVDANAVTAQAQAMLEDWLRSRYSEVRVEPVKNGYAVDVGLAADETVFVRPFAGPVASRSAMWVDIGRAGNSLHRSFPIWFAVEAHAQVPVAAGDIPAGSRLAATQIATADVDIAGIGNSPLIGEKDIAGAIALAPLRQGDILTRDRFRTATPVEAGDEVRLRVRAGTLTVEAHGIALESGSNGQHVRVRNAGSGEVLVASVAGHDVVEVLP